MSQSDPVIRKLEEKFGDDLRDCTAIPGDPVVMISPANACAAVAYLKNDPELAFTMFIDICGAHYPDRQEPFEVIYTLRSLSLGRHLRLRVPLSGDKPSLPSLTPVFEAANWYERETFDMFGITFTGHPNLSRILTHDEFKGHALRKDYVSTERHVCTKTKDLQ